MKKHLLALAALATVSGVAAAQSATVYGIVDLSVTSISKQGSGSGSNTTALTDAVWMPSVFGITASEDLGGGLKAAVNLESDINADTGKVSNASSIGDVDPAGTRKLFGRKANVSLSGGFGTLTAGKDIDMIFLQGFIDNIRNSHSASGFV
ncbi:MAG: porin, partial [Polynucleobacter victoriensis]